MKRRTVLAGAAVFGAIAVIIVLLAGGIPLPLPTLSGIALSRTQTSSSSASMLESIRDMAELQTVSGVCQIVFPHDFYLSGVSGRDLIGRLPDGGEENLTTEERIHLGAYNLALETGLAPSRDERNFLVMTVVVLAGFDLSADLPIGLETDGETTTILLPEAAILDIRIEDMTRENYDFPDVSITPNELRQISTFVREQVERFPEITALRELARTQALSFFSALFFAKPLVTG